MKELPQPSVEGLRVESLGAQASQQSSASPPESLPESTHEAEYEGGQVDLAVSLPKEREKRGMELSEFAEWKSK